MEVKDNFRSVVRAVADGDLYCGTLTAKVDSKWPQNSIRHNAKVISASIDGERYPKVGNIDMTEIGLGEAQWFSI